MGVVLVDRKDKIIAELKLQLAMGLNAAAIEWVSGAKAKANVDTGFMKEHIGITKSASSADLSAEIRSLAPYSGPQDTGIHGNLFWTSTYLEIRERFSQFLYGKAGSAGPGVIRAAQQDFHGPLGSSKGGKP